MPSSDSAERFGFAFASSYRLPALLFGVTPWTTWVEVTTDELRVRFGPWSLRTRRSNITDVEVSGGYSFLKSAGPAHLSFTDRGVAFATNGDRGVCLAFREPVKGLDPTGQIRHPGATMTVADPDALASLLSAVI